MSISENQLETWANQGATTTAQNTHASIRNALKQYSFSSGITYDDYLQGSYRNSTNIFASSDVDLVVELTSTVYTNVTAQSNYNWQIFRQGVISALTKYYGSQFISTSGSKSIKVLPGSGRLLADVVVAAKYRHYSGGSFVAEGMTLWNTKTGQQIINFPKQHIDNGATKNGNTSQQYKPTVRMFKNARKRICENKPLLANRFPSYYVECLLYNVQNSKFSTSRQDTYCNVVNWLNSELNTNSSRFMCQNGLIQLFGNDSTQWNVADAKLLVSELISLWNS